MEDLRDTPLSETERKVALADLSAWSPSHSNNGIRRSYQLRSFEKAIAFVNRIADVARRLEHHPEITIRFSRVEVSCWTFECDGLTTHDIDLARAIDAAHLSPE